MLDFFQCTALLVSGVFWTIRSSHDSVKTTRDSNWVLLLWSFVSPWRKSRWVLMAWISTIYFCYFIYRQKRLQHKHTAHTIAEFQNDQGKLQHGLYNEKFDYNHISSPLKPMIFPCRTSHTRLFPKKHTFSYSYLFVGIPVGWRGYTHTILSADLRTIPWYNVFPRTSWFNVDSANHLARGEHMHGLKGKLDDYLHSQVSTADLRFSTHLNSP